MASTQLDSGRIHQKMRTRSALLQAARELLEEKQELSIEAVAEKALVSRATAYRYYSSVDALIIEAVLETRIQYGEKQLAALDSQDLGKDLSRFQHTWLDFFEENEAALRKFLSISQERWLEQKGKAEVRGDRRSAGFERLLEKAGEEVAEEEVGKLKFILCVLTSLEALIVLKDSCQLPGEDAKAILDWGSAVLIKAVLRDRQALKS